MHSKIYESLKPKQLIIWDGGSPKLHNVFHFDEKRIVLASNGNDCSMWLWACGIYIFQQAGCLEDEGRMLLPQHLHSVVINLMAVRSGLSWPVRAPVGGRLLTLVQVSARQWNPKRHGDRQLNMHERWTPSQQRIVHYSIHSWTVQKQKQKWRRRNARGRERTKRTPPHDYIAPGHPSMSSSSPSMCRSHVLAGIKRT